MSDSLKPLYLDYAATTPLDPEVLDVILPWLKNGQANAHARHHAHGQEAAQVVEQARKQIARRIGAESAEVIFTSGATEANNLVLTGLVNHLKNSWKTHIVTSAVEHKSVLATLKSLEAKGFSLSILPVKPCGMIEADMIDKALTPKTGLVSVQAVNNETGTIQPLEEIAAMLKGRGILFHCDAAQALGKIDFDVRRAGADFASLSAHKIHGPQGIGALYIKADKRKTLDPLHHGGGQEDGLRSGTLPVALCAGFGAACELAVDDRQRLQGLRKAFLKKLWALDPVVYGHTDAAWNAPGILNIRFPGIDNETLVMALPGLSFGLGSACSSAGNRYSHVIKAITGSEKTAAESIRISFGRFTTGDELDDAANQIIAAVTEIRMLQKAA